MVDLGWRYIRRVLAKERHWLCCVGDGITRISIQWCDAYYFIGGETRQYSNGSGNTSSPPWIAWQYIRQVSIKWWYWFHYVGDGIGVIDIVSNNETYHGGRHTQQSNSLGSTSASLSIVVHALRDDVMGKWFGIFNNYNSTHLLQNRIKEYSSKCIIK